MPIRSDTILRSTSCRDVTAIVEVVSRVQVAGLDEAELRALLEAARQVQASVDALIYRVGTEADRLAKQGRSAPAEDLFTSGNHVRKSTAKQDATRSRTIHDVTGLEDAATTGQIGSDHIDILARQFKKLAPEERAQLDNASLVAKAVEMPPERFDRAVKSAIDRIRSDHGLKDAQQKRDAAEFVHWFDHKTGMGKFSGQLDPERYEAFSTAIDQHTTNLAKANNTPTSKDANLAAAALVGLVTSSGNRAAHLPHITVVVDHQTLAIGPHDNSLCETGNGHHLPPETVDRLACDSILQRVTLDKRGAPIDVGRKYRTATDTQWTAIRSIYSTCAWGGCNQPLNWCQLHHITEWRNGGTTDLNNLIPLCPKHHHRVHEGQWSVKLKPDRSMEIFKPNATFHQTTSPPKRGTPAVVDRRLSLQGANKKPSSSQHNDYRQLKADRSAHPKC